MKYIHIEFHRFGWLCNADVVSGPSHFIHGPPPMLFVDIVHPTRNDPDTDGVLQSYLSFHDVQRSIQIGSFTCVTTICILNFTC